MTQNADQAALALFEQLLDLSDSERKRVLASDDVPPALRRRVETMLALDSNTDPFLDGGAEEHLAPLIEQSTTPDINGYEILEKLGEGGMASVYRARRRADYDQQVALKLIRHHNFSPLWEKRFVRERQILATLRHPNIAQLIEGGTTADGHPFLALEFVDGASLTQHANQNRLNLDQRLALVLSVCDAVSYAHRQLVIHRDLKPANILVDEHGVVKLLDFGIAKLLSDEPGEVQTLTEHRALTPEYAAPEQFFGKPVSTATDVYALGVITYELLCGRRPFADDPQNLDLRLSGDPPSFSRQMATVDEPLREQIAQLRTLSWPRLSARLKGDIQNVVLKALSPEPESRYASVEAMATDLRSYLDGRPVTARSGQAYRLRRFVVRNRLWLGASALLLVATISGIVATLYQARESQREAALAQAVQSFFINEMLSAARPEVSRGNTLGVVEVLEQTARRIDGAFVDEPALQARLRQTTGTSLMSLGRFDAAQPLLEQALEDLRGALGPEHLATLAAQSQLGQLRLELGQPADAKQLLAPTLENLKKAAPFDRVTLVAQGRLAQAELQLGQREQAQALQEQALADLEQHQPDAWRERLTVMDGLFSTLADKRNTEAAEVVARRLLALQQEKLGSDHPDIAATLHRIGEIARRKFRYAEATSMYEQAFELRRRVLGQTHPDTLGSLSRLASISWFRGEYGLMEQQMRELLILRSKALGEDHAHVFRTRGHLALALRMQNKFAEAEPLYRAAAEFEVAIKGSESPDAFRQLRNLQWMLVVSGQHQKALTNGRRTIEISHEAAADPSLDPVRLADFAYWLLTIEPVVLRDPATALLWARRANDNTDAPHADVLDTLSLALKENGLLDEAYQMIQTSAALPDSLYDFSVESRAVSILAQQGRLEEADRFLRARLQFREQQGSEEVMVGWTHLSIGRNLLDMGEPALAEKALIAAQGLFSRSLPQNDRYLWLTNSDLTAALLAMDRVAEAEALALPAYQGLKADHRVRGPAKRQALGQVIDMYQRLGQTDTAARWQKELEEKSRLHDRAIW